MRVPIALGALLFLFALRLHARYGDARLHISFLDVGQGDSALIQLPGGRSFLVDAGMRSQSTDRGREVVIPALASLGILELEAVLLTHPDADHLGGVLEVLKRLNVGAFWLPRSFLPPRGTQLQETLAAAQHHGVSVLPWVAPAVFVLSPGIRWWVGLAEGDSDNDRSLLVRLSFGNCSVLFTGDIGAMSERRLSQVGQTTLLKVSHHGSRFSSDPLFLSRIRPRFAVVSAGSNNRYGHPHPNTLERLHRVGSEVLRTDFHGRVDFTFDSQGRYRCESALGFCGSGYCSDSKPN